LLGISASVAITWYGEISDSFQVMRPYRFFFFSAAWRLRSSWRRQTAVDVPGPKKTKQNNAIAKEQEKNAHATTTVEFSGEQHSKKRICARGEGTARHRRSLRVNTGPG